jgi:SAM-dependent methyltransferase
MADRHAITTAPSDNHLSQSDYFGAAKYRSPDDTVVAAYANPKLDFIEQAVPLRQSSVLDVGCGNGVFTLYLQQRCKSVFGADFSANMLCTNPCSQLMQADAASLPVQGGSFDIAFEANLLHHADDPARVVSELTRAARRWVVLIEPNRYNPVMLAFGLVVKAERKLLHSSPKMIKALLTGCGLSVRLCVCTGMISQNNTPAFMIPLLRPFDRQFAFGEYIVAVGEKA